VVGTATSNGLLALRQRADPSFALPNAPPGVLANAGTWAAHMGVSSNLRYQALNGLDAALAPLLPPGVFRAWSVAIRTANNVAGGVSFVLLARALGVQQAAAAPTKDDGKKKKK
jgi:Protein RETICULATA-related